MKLQSCGLSHVKPEGKILEISGVSPHRQGAGLDKTQ